LAEVRDYHAKSQRAGESYRCSILTEGFSAARGEVRQSGCAVSVVRLLCVRKLHLLTPSIHDILAPGWPRVVIPNVQRSCVMPDSFLNKSLAQFLDDLASSAPVPGGGSTAALTGALAAALVSMVGNLTVGKKRYANVEAEVKALLDRSELLRRQLADLLEADTQVYSSLSKAYKLPRDSDEQKATRTAAIQAALKEAEAVPMQIAEACVEVLDLCIPMAEKGKRLAVSDAGVAALLAEAGLRSAALNVLINLAYIKDEDFVRRERAKLDRLLEGKAQLKEQVYELVVSKL